MHLLNCLDYYSTALSAILLLTKIRRLMSEKFQVPERNQFSCLSGVEGSGPPGGFDSAQPPLSSTLLNRLDINQHGLRSIIFLFLTGILCQRMTFRCLSAAEGAVCLISALSQPRQFFEPALHQCFLFLSAPALHLLFPAERFVNPGKFLVINQLHRQPPGGVLCACASLMLGKSLFKIFRASCVITSVSAFENIYESACHCSLCDNV
jgi:hypothetical protein